MSEINILCIKPKGKIVYNKKLFYLEKGKCYADNWEVVGALQGEWYRVYSRSNYNKDDFVCGAYDIVNSVTTSNFADYYKHLLADDFDALFKKDNPGNTTEYISFINTIMRDEFCNLIHNIIENSKIKSVMILFRESLDPPEKIVGCITIDKFIDLLNKNQVYQNLAYIVKERNEDEKYWEL